MPLATIPAADANACGSWTEQDNNLYNKLSFYLAKMQVERRKTYPVWNRFCGKKKWTPNMGTTMRNVTTEPSPHIRQFAFPQPITGTPKKDVIDIRERKQDEVVYKHRFESLTLDYLASFQDFMNHVDDNSQDLMDKEERFEDIFYRGRIFHRAPYVWCSDRAAGELIAAPTGDGNSLGTDAKTTNFLQQLLMQIGPQGYLSMAQLNKALTVMETDLRVPAFSGSGLPKDDAGLADKFGLVLSSEAWNQFTFDPYLLANKNCQLDIVNGRFKGSLFGRITSILEDMPLRMKVDGTFTAPETRETNPGAYNYGETIPNPVYTSLDDVNGSPYEFAFLTGASGYDVIDVGPPPAQFASSGMPKGFGKMFWNGEIELTKNFLVPCYDDAGTLTWDTNKYGEKAQFISQVTYGMIAKQPRNIVPILFRRKRGQ